MKQAQTKKQINNKNTSKKTSKKIDNDVEFVPVENDNASKEIKLSKEQQEIVNLKSKLMVEKIKNVGKKGKSNFITKKQKRKFRDTENDKNATWFTILKGAAVMIFGFGLFALIILIAS